MSEPVKVEIYSTRLADAVGQLERYGNFVCDDRILDIIDQLTEINDDIVHGRHRKFIEESADKIQKTLQAIIEGL